MYDTNRNYNLNGVCDCESGRTIDDGLESCDGENERSGVWRRLFHLGRNFLEVVQQYWTAPQSWNSSRYLWSYPLSDGYCHCRYCRPDRFRLDRRFGNSSTYCLDRNQC